MDGEYLIYVGQQPNHWLKHEDQDEKDGVLKARKL